MAYGLGSTRLPCWNCRIPRFVCTIPKPPYRPPLPASRFERSVTATKGSSIAVRPTATADGITAAAASGRSYTMAFWRKYALTICAERRFHFTFPPEHTDRRGPQARQ